MPCSLRKNLVQVLPQAPTPNKPNAFGYQIIMFEALPVVDLSQTVLHRVFKVSPRTHDKLSNLIDRRIMLIYGSYAIGYACTTICFLSKDIVMQSYFAVASFVFTIPFLLMYLMLNAQMAYLVIKRYEFWFLFTTATVLFLVMSKVVMPNAWRIFACANIWIGLVYTFFFDATPRFRVAHLRFMIAASPFLLVDLLAIMGRVVEPANYDNSLNNGRALLQDTDLVLNCYIIIGIFYGFRLFMNYQWLCPVPGQINFIRCHTFRPSHGLVQASSCLSSTMAVASSSAGSSFSPNSLIQPITLIPMIDGLVNARKLNFKSNATLSPLPRWQLMLIHACGFCGLATTCLSLGISISGISVGSASMIACIGLGCTQLYCLASFIYSQRDLAMLMYLEIDVWFASVQYSLATLCFIDMLCWDFRILSCLSFHSWFHWVLFADALSPISKEVLGIHRRLSILVITILMMYLLTLSVWLGWRDDHVDAPFTCSADKNTNFSPSSSSTSGNTLSWFSTPALVNRVVIQYASQDNKVQFQMETMSMFTSRLVTCVLWTGRLLWREVFRPRDAFRMIRSRVQYRVPVTWDN